MTRQELRNALIERMRTLSESGLNKRSEKREFSFMSKMYKKHVIKYSDDLRKNTPNQNR